MMTDWNLILSNKTNRRVVLEFVTGQLSGRGLYSHFKNTDLGGQIRNLLRVHGVEYSRRLAQKALSRRVAAVV